MKPFNLEKALAGHPICTKSGLPARILTSDFKGQDRSLVVAVLIKGCEYIQYYYKNGRMLRTLETNDDLCLKTENHSGWINIYTLSQTSTDIYKTKEEALSNRECNGYVDTIKITWNE